MQETYGDPGVAAYYAPQPIVVPNYQPQPITTDDDLNYLSSGELSQKIHTDLDGYFDISSVLANAQNVSPAVQNSLNNFSDILQNLAGTELDGYINNTTDITNFNEDAYYTQVKSKVDQAIGNYMYNIGNNIGLTPNEQTSILVASTYTSALVETSDFRDQLTSYSQINNSMNSVLKTNTIKTSGLFSSIGNVFRRAAKVVVLAAVTAVVFVASAVVGAAIGAGLGFLGASNPGGENISVFGVGAFTALGGGISGLVTLFTKTHIWSWALKN